VIRFETRYAGLVSPRTEPGPSSSARPPSRGSSEVAARRSEPSCRIVVFGPRDGEWGWPAGDSTRDNAHRAASPRTEPGPLPERRSLAGVTRREQLASRSFSFEGGLRTTRQREGTTGG
jgi:hypothetical protein